MKLTSITAIYILMWVFAFFLVLPFRLQRRNARDVTVPGEMRGSQGSFSFARSALWATIVSAVLFGLYYANYVFGWVPVGTFDLVPKSVLESGVQPG